MNRYRMLLDRLAGGYGLDAESLRQVLSPIEVALRGIRTELDKLPPPPEGDEEALEMYAWQVEDLRSRMEDLLGIAFVLCQRHITRVVSLVFTLRERVKEDAGKNLPSVPSSRPAILSICSSTLPGSSVTQVQAIEGFANYFKHEDEWPGKPWSEFDGIQKRTADSITAAGAEEGSTENFRSGAKALGNSTFDDLEVFIRILLAWQEAIHAQLKAELVGLKLV